MKKIATTQYKGQLRVSCVHLDSDNEIITDAPKDNQGEGKAFSPTDLLCTSLASCILTIMGIKARDNDIDMSGSVIKVSKEMQNNPRRVRAIELEIDMSQREYSPEQMKILKRGAKGCPVERSLHEDTAVNMTWKWKS